jgi:hypothetical protein
MEEYSERIADHEFSSIIGIVKPQNGLTDADPVGAIQALQTIRRVSHFLSKLSYSGAEWSQEDMETIGDLADCIHLGAGHVLEYLEKQVRPQFMEAHSPYSVTSAKETTAG